MMTDFKIPDDQLAAWQRDQAGRVVDAGLASKFGWKIGDRVVLERNDLPRRSGIDGSRNLYSAAAEAAEQQQQQQQRSSSSKQLGAMGVERMAATWPEGG